MTNKQIKKYLNQRYDERVADLLFIYVSNDSRLAPRMYQTLESCGKKYIKKGNFDIYQFTQVAKYEIDRMLSDRYFRKEYYDLPSRIDLPTRYYVASRIAEYVAYDYLNLNVKWED